MLVSVVIPSYNHRQYVIQAIESVLDQDWPEIDLIVIDDGSRDGSPELIQELLDRRGGFRFIARENRGLIATLNEGVRLAEGEALCVLASDDFLWPGSIRCRAEFLLRHPDHVAVFGDGSVVGPDGKETVTILKSKNRKLFTATDPVPLFLQGANVPIHPMLVRRIPFLRVGGFDRRYFRCEDLDVQLLLFLEGPVGLIEDSVYAYRRHETNQSQTRPGIAKADKVLCFRKYLEEIPKLAPYRSMIRSRLRRHYLQLGRSLAERGGGEKRERDVLRGGWSYAWKDPRLLWYLCRFGR